MTNTTPEMKLLYVAPKDIIIDANVRTETHLDTEFVNSIKTNGIIQPPTGWIDADGMVHIEAGQRRVLGAIKAKLETMPVVVVPREKIEQERIIVQLAENDHRAPLRDAEHVAAYQQLALFGMKADQIAKQTKTPRERVRTALKFAAKENVVDAMRTHQLTLEQGEILAEFADDPAVLEKLVTTATTERDNMFKYRAAHYRRERAYAALVSVERKRLEAEGYTVVAEDELTDAHVALDELIRDDMPDGVTEEQAEEFGGLVMSFVKHAKWDDEIAEWLDCPERVFYVIDHEEHGYQRRQTKQPARAQTVAADSEELLASRSFWQDAVANRDAWYASQIIHAGMSQPQLELQISTVMFELVIEAIRGWGHASDLAVDAQLEKWGALASGAVAEMVNGETYSELFDAQDQALLLALVGKESKLQEFQVSDEWARNAAEFLTLLAACGYQLFPIEEQLIAKIAEGAA